MTRRKKSRKPGVLGAKSQPKEMRAHERSEPGKRPDKTKGRPAGNRHSIVSQAHRTNKANQLQSDPRKGSKRKIELTVSSTASSVAPSTASRFTDQQAAALVAVIEQDERLEQILEAIDADKQVSADDRAYAKEQTALYERLVEQLGLDVEHDEAEDEDDLEPWRKFDDPSTWV